MGMIVNSFDKFMKLKEDSRILNRFKLTAIIVHDPNDTDFCNQIRNDFVDLASMTGMDFLFLTFIKPSVRYAKSLQSGTQKYAMYVGDPHVLYSDFENYMIPLLRKYFDITTEGSYLVFARNLMDTNYYKVKVSKKSLCKQFELLVDYCERSRTRLCYDNDWNFQELIAALQAEKYVADEAMIDSILSVTSIISPACNGGMYSEYVEKQQEIASETIRKAKHRLKNTCNTDEDQSEEVINLYNVIESVNQRVFDNPRPQTRYSKCLYYDKLDKTSRRFWNTYVWLSSAMNYAKPNELLELDYAASVIYLAKIFENELNLSVCQMMRYAMGIDMPEYYNRYCKLMRDVKIPTVTHYVRINRYEYNGRRQELAGVASGDLLCAYRTMLETINDYNFFDDYDGWRVEFPERFVTIPLKMESLWEDFVKIRNKAAHTVKVRRQDYQEAIYLFDDFMHQYMQIIDYLKNKLSNYGTGRAMELRDNGQVSDRN